jgi:hypothetical protein
MLYCQTLRLNASSVCQEFKRHIVALATFVDSVHVSLRRISFAQILVFIPFMYFEIVCVNNVSFNKSQTDSNLTKQFVILALKNVLKIYSISLYNLR